MGDKSRIGKRGLGEGAEATSTGSVPAAQPVKLKPSVEIERADQVATIQGLISRHPVVGIVGPRQVGKTTLARAIAARYPGPAARFDLENPSDSARFADPMLALNALTGLVVIDEVQLKPDLFPILRVLADRPETPARFLVLGSASPDLLRQGSETLAGRIIYHQLDGFTLDEVGAPALDVLWLRGGFPRSFLAPSDAGSDEWRQGFLRTFLERDLPQLGISVNATTMRRFWTMLAHYHGQTWNASEFARAFGLRDKTVRAYLDHLTDALVVRQVQPWHENISKRQVRSPKVYIADSGLLHALLNLPAREDLERHPKVGASWEGFLLRELVHHLRARPDECFFWATHAGAELDLLVVRGGRRRGFEFKRTSAPRTDRGMHSAINDLRLDTLDLIHAGDSTYPLAPRIRAVAASRLSQDVAPF